MEIRNLIRFTNIFIINLLVFISLWILAEIINYFVNPLNKRSNRITCNYDWILYNYCPNIIDVKKNTKNDGSSIIFTYTNDIGQRVIKKNKKTNFSAKHVFIGDSFIQAEELEYEKTFYGLLEKDFEVTAFGYSSWNIVQYSRAIEKLAIKNTHYHIFLMPNDIHPDYGRSVFAEERGRRLKIPKSLWVKIDPTPDLKKEFDKIYKNSLSKLFLDLVQSKPKSKKFIKVLNKNKFSKNFVNDCDVLYNLSDEYKKTIGYDYLVYSKSIKCWSDYHKEAANFALLELKKLINIVRNLSSEVTFYLSPAGWSFPNQNTNGRKNNEYYFFDDNISITTEPLLDFFSNSLPSEKFINLENYFNNWISSCIDCKDQFYFADDGHWTPKTHKLLYNFFLRSLK